MIRAGGDQELRRATLAFKAVYFTLLMNHTVSGLGRLVSEAHAPSATYEQLFELNECVFEEKSDSFWLAFVDVCRTGS